MTGEGGRGNFAGSINDARALINMNEGNITKVDGGKETIGTIEHGESVSREGGGIGIIGGNIGEMSKRENPSKTSIELSKEQETETGARYQQSCEASCKNGEIDSSEKRQAIAKSCLH